MNDAINVVDFATLREFFEGQDNIVSVFIFGSSQNGQINPGSDIDIAILFEDIPSVNDKLELYSNLCDVVNLNVGIDMIVLNKADTILAFEAISGRRLVDKNPRKTAEFSSYTSRLYEDTMANINSQLKLRVK